MSAAELKNDLHKLVVETDDINILNKVQFFFNAILKGEAADWADELTAIQKQKLDKSIADLEAGRVLSNEDVRANIDKWINERR